MFVFVVAVFLLLFFFVPHKVTTDNRGSLYALFCLKCMTTRPPKLIRLLRMSEFYIPERLVICRSIVQLSVAMFFVNPFSAEPGYVLPLQTV